MMRTLILTLAFGVGLSVFFLPSCKHDPLIPLDVIPIDTSLIVGQPCSPDTAYFLNQVLPILISQCAKSGCHDLQSHKEGIVLTDYDRVISTGEVKPFKGADSKLYKVLVDSDPDDRMPEPPNPPLSADQINIIKKWIDQGALNNGCEDGLGNCVTQGVTYSNFVSGLFANRCVGCHSGANPGGSLKLTTYAEVKASAQGGRLMGAISHASGYSAMPKGGAPLSTCYVDKVQAWINDGMPQ